jgi:hypothetical protein
LHLDVNRRQIATLKKIIVRIALFILALKHTSTIVYILTPSKV